jgi:tRNA threonylcarbamoyladenosine biosynthesis protein TsaE
VEVVARTADDTRAVGERLARLLRPGDLVVLSGDLGAGKTTLTQGLGSALQVRGGVTSPTFVISRVHPSLVGGPSLVHVDAYRLGTSTRSAQPAMELDDLDLDTSLEDAVTVVEWGIGVAEVLADNRLEVELLRAPADRVEVEGETRRLRLRGVGPRWAGVDLAAVAPA